MGTGELKKVLLSKPRFLKSAPINEIAKKKEFLEEFNKLDIKKIDVPEESIFKHGSNLQSLGKHRGYLFKTELYC